MAASKNFKKPNLSDFNPMNSNFSFGRLAEDIMGVVMNAQTGGRDRMKTELERLLHRMDIVTRRELDIVREIAIAARTQAEELAEQVNGGSRKKPAAKKVAPAKKAVQKAAPAKKPAAKKAPVKKATRR